MIEAVHTTGPHSRSVDLRVRIYLVDKRMPTANINPVTYLENHKELSVARKQ
jgi:hypothetical protein